MLLIFSPDIQTVEITLYKEKKDLEGSLLWLLRESSDFCGNVVIF